MRIALLAAPIFVVLTIFTAFGADDFTAAGIPKELPRIIATSWNQSDQLGHQLWYRENQGLFLAYFSNYVKFGKADFCRSLLEQQQVFALSRMVNRGYISREQAEVLIRLGEKLKPSQFHFYELVKALSHAEAEKLNLQARAGDISLTAIPAMTDLVGVIQATLWTIAAQSTSSHVRFQYEKMGWQLDPEFAHVGLNRDIFKFGWELGRGVQNEARSIDILLKPAVLGMIHEIMTYGGRIEDGYVFIHTLGEAQNRAFKLRKIANTHQPLFQVYATDPKNPYNEVLLAKLSDLILTWPPENSSQAIHDLLTISGPRLDWFGAAQHLFSIRDTLRQDLDFVDAIAPHRASPIIMRNFTPIPGWFMSKVSERLGVYDIGPRLVNYLNSISRFDSNFHGDFIVDEEVPGSVSLGPLKGIALSNFDATVAANHPEYVRLVLLSAYLYYSRELEQTFPFQKASILAQTRWIVNSGHTAVLIQAQAIQGGQVASFKIEKTKVELATGPNGIMVQPRIRISVGPGFIFNPAAMEQLVATSSPDLTRRANRALRKANWQIQNHLSDAIGF